MEDITITIEGDVVEQTVVIENNSPAIEVSVETEIEPVTIEIAEHSSGGSSGDGSALLIYYVAQEDITIGDVVIAGGRVANSSTVGHRNKIIGVAKANVSNGFAGQVVGFGKIQNADWSWVAGDRIYLNGTTLSTISPTTGYLTQIGIATVADTIDINIQPGILL